ncbi:MAG: 50S ribosomal protein L4 [Bacilli bacterium]|nr:50S ribosomal protein L4 [Bacilli bacterium]
MAESKKITVDVVNATGAKVSTIDLNSKVFGVKPNDQAIYHAVKLANANARQATAKTKKRSEVSGGGKKPWRQKGTGRARAGSTRSPIWVGGGTVFGPKGVQNFKLNQNRKEHQLAMYSALSLKAKKGLVVIDELKTDKKTKSFNKIIKALKLEGKTLVVVSKVDTNLMHAAHNLSNVKLLDLKHLNVYDVMNARNLLLTADVVKEVK